MTKAKNKKLKIMIIAGEPSGDIHGALLMKQIKLLYNNVEFIGIGGEKMIQEGLKSIIDISKIAVVGFIEVIKQYRVFSKLLKKCKKLLLTESIDCFIPIDYPGFNIKIAKYAYDIEIPVYYYIAPQLWAWGKNRYKKLQEVITKLLVVFPFEEHFFNQRGINATFIGHPLLDNPIFNLPSKNFEEKENIIAFFPGSRRQELKKNLELFINTADLLNENLNNYSFEFAVSSNLSPDDFSMLKFYNFNYKLVNNSIDLMRRAKIGVVKTGTTTLEASLLGLNMVMAYKASLSHYILGKYLVNLDYLSLPNILLNKEIIPECIQKQATPKRIAQNVLNLLNNHDLCTKQQQEFNKIREILGHKGAAFNAANIILQDII